MLSTRAQLLLARRGFVHIRNFQQTNGRVDTKTVERFLVPLGSIKIGQRDLDPLTNATQQAQICTWHRDRLRIGSQRYVKAEYIAMLVTEQKVNPCISTEFQEESHLSHWLMRYYIIRRPLVRIGDLLLYNAQTLHRRSVQVYTAKREVQLWQIYQY